MFAQELDTLEHFEESELVEHHASLPFGFPYAGVYFEVLDSLEYDIKEIRFTLMPEGYYGPWEFPDTNYIYIFQSNSDFDTDTSLTIPVNSNLPWPGFEGEWLTGYVPFVNNESHIYPGWCSVQIDTISSLQNLTGDFWVFGGVLLNTMVDIAPPHEYNTFYMPQNDWESNLQDRAIQAIIEYEELSTVTIQPIPSVFQLSPAAPNPFNPTTTIKYEIPEQSQIKLQIFDIAGRLVNTITDNEGMSGTHQTQWSGTNQQGEPVSSGMYIVRMNATSAHGKKSFTQSQKIVLLK